MATSLPRRPCGGAGIDAFRFDLGFTTDTVHDFTDAIDPFGDKRLAPHDSEGPLTAADITRADVTGF